MKLKEIAKVQGGFAFKSDSFVSNETPIIRIGNIINNEIVIDKDITAPISTIGDKKEFLIFKDDLLIAMSGATVGKVGIYNFDSPSMLNQRVGNIKSDKMYKKYIFYLLQSPKFKKYVELSSIGCAQPNISNSQIENFEFKENNIDQIEKMVRKLDSVNSLINIKKSGIEKCKELVKSQFVEMFGDIESNSNNYKIVELSEISDYWNGLTYKPSNIVDKDGTIVLRSSNIQESKIDYKDIVRVDCNIGEKKFVNENDILMCSRNGSSRLVGKVALIPRTDEKMSFGAFMMIIRSKYYPYLFTYFQTNAFRKQISTGATTTINQITTNMMNKVKLPLPSEQDIEKFNILLKQIDKQKFEFEKSLKKLEELQASLMQEYFG